MSDGTWEDLSYLFDNKKEVSSFLYNPKILDPSYKMDLDFWDFFGRQNLSYSLITQAQFI